MIHAKVWFGMLVHLQIFGITDGNEISDLISEVEAMYKPSEIALQRRRELCAALPGTALVDESQCLPDVARELQRVQPDHLKDHYLRKVEDAESKAVVDHESANLTQKRHPFAGGLEPVGYLDLGGHHNLGTPAPGPHAKLRFELSVDFHLFVIASDLIE